MNVVFIESKYAQYFVASRRIKEYAKSDINTGEYKVDQDNLLVKSNLIGLNDKIIKDFINKSSGEPCIGTCDNHKLSLIHI